MSIHLDNRPPQAPPAPPIQAPAPPIQAPAPPIQAPAPPIQAPAPRTTDRRIIAAIALIAVGVLALIGTFTSSRIFGLSFLPMLGVIFLAWGLLARIPGLLIPGGILTGLGVGVLLTDQVFATAAGDVRGGVVVLGLALGFAVITPLAGLIAGGTPWWALVVGGILALVGAVLIIGGPALEVLNVVGRLWPVALIAFGAYLIWQVARKR